MTTIEQQKNDISEFIEQQKKEHWGCAALLDYHINRLIEDGATLEQIKEVYKHNFEFIHEHGLDISDIEKYFKIQKEINSATKKSKNKLKYGDALEIWSNNERIFYKNAHIERATYYNEGFTYCEQPYVPFYCGNGGFQTSGGAWGKLDPGKCEYLGKKKKLVWTWGHCGARGNGGLRIEAEVNNFKIVIDRKFVPYSVCYGKEPDEYGYKFYFTKRDKQSMFCQTAFRTKTGLKNYLKNRNLKIGKLFNKGWSTSHEVIGDFDEKCYMDFNEFKADKGDLKTFPKLSNGDYTEAFLKDGNVCYCNPNVKQRAILPRPIYC